MEQQLDGEVNGQAIGKGTYTLVVVDKGKSNDNSFCH